MRAAREEALLKIAAAVIVLLSALRIASTYRLLSETSDEPTHVRAGLEWLGRGTYAFSPVDPPLSRLPAAIGPFVAGYRFARPGFAPPRGLSVDRMDSDDPTPLSIARAGVLPFFVLTAWLVWLWARHLAGPRGALVAVAILSCDPNVSAHAGLATTDMPFTAIFVATLFAFLRWWEVPTLSRALLTGALFGLALATKFTAFALPVCALAIAALLGTAGAHSRGRLFGHALSASAIGGAALGAVYRFDFASWVDGIWELIREERVGHPSYLLGTWTDHGAATHYAVGLLAKTPIPLLIAVSFVAFVVRTMPGPKRARLLSPAVAAVVLLVVASFGHIKIGMRHVLPVFPLFAIVAACTVMAVFERPASRAARIGFRVAAGALGLWYAAGSLAVHPEYLSYFNEAVGTDGDLVLLDSDFDWGQDLWYLEHWLREFGVDRVHVAYFGPAVLLRHDLPALLPLERNERVTGWIAISAMYRRSPGFGWLSAYAPVARAGRSILLYFIPDAPGA